MKRTPLLLIFLIAFIDLLGFGIVIPILPSYATKNLGADEFMIGVIVASFSFMMFIFTPIWGRVSDRIGRKPVLLIGLVSSIIGYLTFALTDSLTMLIASRMLAGIGGANISAAQAYIADVTPPDQRAKGMGLIGSAFGLGFVFGPFIGGNLSVYGYHVPGFFAAGLSAISLVVTIIFLPSPPIARQSEQASKQKFFSGKNWKYLIGHANVSNLIFLQFLLIFAMSNIYANFALFGIKDYHLSDREVGYLFACIGVMNTIMQGGVLRQLTKIFSERTLFVIGNCIMFIGLLSIPFSPGVVALFLATALYAIGTGMVIPTSVSLLSQNVSGADQGTVLGINQSVSSLARIFGPMIGGLLFLHIGHQMPFFGSAFITLLATALSLRLLSKDRLLEPVLHLE